MNKILNKPLMFIENFINLKIIYIIMKENKVVTISAQIPADLEKSLIKLCEFEERSKSYFIKKALEKLIQEKIKEVANTTIKKSDKK
jgi:predicted DNA-binding protein